MNISFSGWELEKNQKEVLESFSLKKASEWLDLFLENCSLSAISSDYSRVVVIRKCRVQFWEGERRVFPVEPDSDDYHWGIGVVTCTSTGSCISGTTYIPNGYDYESIEIDNNNEIVIETNRGTRRLTFDDLKLLAKYWKVFDEAELDKEFDSLSTNVKIAPKILTTEQFIKNIAKQDIENTPFGLIAFNAKIGIYQTFFDGIKLFFEDSGNLNVMIERVSRILKENLYDKYLNRALIDILKLKNDLWLEEHETNFKKRDILDNVKLESITTLDNGNIELVFEAGEIFSEHVIVITIDNQEQYKSFYIE